MLRDAALQGKARSLPVREAGLDAFSVEYEA